MTPAVHRRLSEGSAVQSDRVRGPSYLRAVLSLVFGSCTLASDALLHMKTSHPSASVLWLHLRVEFREDKLLFKLFARDRSIVSQPLRLNIICGAFTLQVQVYRQQATCLRGHDIAGAAVYISSAFVSG
jgi:hypothetical protein